MPHKRRYSVRKTAEQQHLHHRQEERRRPGHAVSVPQTHQWVLDPRRTLHTTWQSQLHAPSEMQGTRGVSVCVPDV